MLETGTAPRGALRVGGVSVALEQLVLVLSMGCERIFCLANRMTPEIAALQHEAERAGARFQLIPGPHGLLGQVTAMDEVIALADGLFASVSDAVALLEPGAAVLVQPAETGVEAGFERIDPTQASGGALRIPGRLVERLADLPHDCDAFSALLRIALQAGVAQRPLPPPARVTVSGHCSTMKSRLMPLNHCGSAAGSGTRDRSIPPAALHACLCAVLVRHCFTLEADHVLLPGQR